MDMQQYDTKGRAVAHYFFSELEKIALSAGLKRRAAHEAQRRVGELAEQLGASRFIPGSKARAAHRAAKKRAERLARHADTSALSEREAVMKRVAGGGPSHKDIAKLRELDEAEAPRSRVGAAAKRVARAVGVASAPPPRPQPSLLSSPKMRAGLAVGTPLAIGGGLYAGKKYLDSQRDPYSQGY